MTGGWFIIVFTTCYTITITLHLQLHATFTYYCFHNTIRHCVSVPSSLPSRRAAVLVVGAGFIGVEWVTELQMLGLYSERPVFGAGKSNVLMEYTHTHLYIYIYVCVCV